MFKKSVAGLCSSFTANLEKIMKTCSEESDVQEAIIEAATDKQVEADREFNQANKALHNIRELFGVD